MNKEEIKKSNLRQLDELKKPVVPKFVAEWIEECKRNKKSLYYALESSDEVNRWIERDDKIRENEDTFARAWLDGYEIEKDKLYTVEIPNSNAKYSRIVLQRLRENALHLKEYTGEDWKTFRMNQLTESEIKQDFEWAWQWAEEVVEK